MQPVRTTSVYLWLALAWLVVAGWQGTEHYRFRRVAYDALLNRGREIASTMGVVIRSQGRFGIVRQARLEAALEELAHSTDLQAVVLLSASGQVVATAGKPQGVKIADLPKQAVRWDKKQGLITIVDLVDLGSTAQSESPPTAIVLGDDAPRRERRPFAPPPGLFPGLSAIMNPDMYSSTTLTGSSGPRVASPMGPGPGPFGISRPFWMDPGRYQELLKKQGLHGFVLQMPTADFTAETRHDLWIRLTTMIVALIGVGGMGLAWRSAQRMAQLQLRLLRASEMNAHLRELNLAAAGLAHETRNPLNIVRGLAQIISQNSSASGEIRQKATVITDEVDRVTGRLNEFISYSHTPEPRLASTKLRAVVRDVQRALESDQAEKAIISETTGPDLAVEADESLLRQVIFNLLLNAYQAVGQGGRVDVVIADGGRGEAALEIRDNGPGVPADLHEEIFKPYFTTRAEGTGLGLAVVRQIVLAHKWEFGYLPGKDGGAIFRVSAIRKPRA